MKKGRNFISLVFIILGFVAVLLWIVSLVVETSTRIESLEIPYLVYVYYVSAVALIGYFLIYPFLVVMFSPTFSYKATINPLSGTQKRKTIEIHYNKMVKFAKKLMRKNRIKPENVELLKQELNRQDLELAEKDMSFQKLLVKVLNEDIKKDIRDIIIDSAKDTLYLTSLSQNGLVDALIVLVNNFRMLKKIVIRCGFRPSFFRLFKFYCNVGISSLVADGAEQIDIQSMLGSAVKSFAKPIIESLVSGGVNAFLMLRTGFLARNYIFLDAEEANGKEEATQGAILDATAALPELTIKSVLTPVANAVNNTIVNPTKAAVKTLFGKKENLIVEEETKQLEEVK